MAGFREGIFVALVANGLDASLHSVFGNGLDANFLLVLGNGLDGIFLFAVGNLLDGIFAMTSLSCLGFSRKVDLILRENLHCFIVRYW